MGRDLYLVMGSFVMGAVLLLVGNLVGDRAESAARERLYNYLKSGAGK